jgi:hypothetical protein
MTQKKSKKQRRTAKQSKQEFTAKTRVYDLLKREFHGELKKLIVDIRPYIRDGDTIDWKHLRYFDFNFDKKQRRGKPECVLVIARFILAIGKGNGLKCKMSVFLRYLAANEHSNLGLKYRSLNTLIYRMFAYLEQDEK